MTHQTNEELREKIASIVKDVRRETDGHYDAVDEIMSLIPQPEQSWEFCPNCGSQEIHYQELKSDGEKHRQCKRCHQEYFSKVDYLESMRLTLEKLYLKSIAQPVNIVSGNEEIKNKLYKVFLDFMESHEEFLESKELPRTFSISYWEDKIMSIISDYKGEIVGYEQLEVEIQECDGVFRVMFIPNTSYETTLNDSKSKQEALDFCERHNLKLKVVNKEKE